MMNLMSKALIGFFAAIVAIVMISSALAPAISPNVSMEARNYSVNGTYYPMAHNPTNSDLHLYYFANTTYEIPAARITQNTTHTALKTNGTTLGACYANITAGCIYYATYSYNSDLTLWGLDFGWILLVIALAVVATIGYAFVKYYLK